MRPALRRQRERLIKRELAVKLPTKHGEFDLIAYTSVVDIEPHLALDIESQQLRRPNRATGFELVTLLSQ